MRGRALRVALAALLAGLGCDPEPGGPAPVTWLDRGSGADAEGDLAPLRPGARFFEDGRIGGDLVAFLGPEAREGSALTEVQTADGLLWLSEGEEGLLLHGGYRDGLLASGPRLTLPAPLREGMIWRVPAEQEEERDYGEITFTVRGHAAERTVWGEREVWTVRQEIAFSDGAALANERRYAEGVGLLDIVDEAGAPLVEYRAGLVPLEAPADWTDGPALPRTPLERVPYARELRLEPPEPRCCSDTHLSYPPPWSASAVDFGDGWPVVAINGVQAVGGEEANACLKAEAVLREMPRSGDREGCAEHGYRVLTGGGVRSWSTGFLVGAESLNFASDVDFVLDVAAVPTPNGALLVGGGDVEALRSTAFRVRRADGARLDVIPTDGSGAVGPRVYEYDAAGELVEYRAIDADWFVTDALREPAMDRDRWAYVEDSSTPLRLVGPRVIAPPTWDGASPLPLVLVGATGAVARSYFDGRRLSAPELLFEVGTARLSTQLFHDRREVLFVSEGGAVDRLVMEPEPGLERLAVLDLPDREQLRAAFTTDGGTRLLAITVAPHRPAPGEALLHDEVRFYAARLTSPAVPFAPRRGTALTFVQLDRSGAVLVCGALGAGELPAEGWRQGGAPASVALDRATGCGVVLPGPEVDLCAPDALTVEHEALPSLGPALLRPTLLSGGSFPQAETDLHFEIQMAIAPVSGGGFVTDTHRYGAGGFRLGWSMAGGRERARGSEWMADTAGRGLWTAGTEGGAPAVPFLRLDGRDASLEAPLPEGFTVRELSPVSGGGVLAQLRRGTSSEFRWVIAAPDGTVEDVTARVGTLSPEIVTGDGRLCGFRGADNLCLAPDGAETLLALGYGELDPALDHTSFAHGWLPLGERWLVAGRPGAGTLVLDASTGAVVAEDPRPIRDGRHDSSGRLFAIAWDGEESGLVEVTPEGLVDVPLPPLSVELTSAECETYTAQPIRVIPDEEAFVLLVGSPSSVTLSELTTLRVARAP